MTEAPKQKRLIGLSSYSRINNRITINTTTDLKKVLEPFGNVYSGPGDTHTLYVDARYDFDDVLDHIRDLCQPLDKSPTP